MPRHLSRCSAKRGQQYEGQLRSTALSMRLRATLLPRTLLSKRGFSDLEIVVRLRNVMMVNPSGDDRTTTELDDGLAWQWCLQRDCNTEQFIGSSVHLLHTTLAQQFLHSIPVPDECSSGDHANTSGFEMSKVIEARLGPVPNVITQACGIGSPGTAGVAFTKVLPVTARITKRSPS